jgi:hypothetical protein
MKFDYYIEHCGVCVRLSVSGVWSSAIMAKLGGLKMVKTKFSHNF